LVALPVPLGVDQPWAFECGAAIERSPEYLLLIERL